MYKLYKIANKAQSCIYHRRLLLSGGKADNRLLAPGSLEVSYISVTNETNVNKISEHIEGDHEAAKKGCREPIQARKLARLLTEYTTVFSTQDGNLGGT